MKQKRFLTLFMTMIIVLSGCGAKESKIEQYLQEQDTIMEKMMTEMDAVENSGNAALDFLYAMIPHHQSAIEMSKSYLNYAAKNSEFQTLANDIINTQDEEIIQMQSMIKRIETNSQIDLEKEAQYLNEYNTMMNAHHMNHGSSSADNLDIAFAEGMIMHHQMAVDMAEAIIPHTDDEEVIEFASGIIDLQIEEISQMQDFLSGNTANHKH